MFPIHLALETALVTEGSTTPLSAVGMVGNVLWRGIQTVTSTINLISEAAFVSAESTTPKNVDGRMETVF